MQIQILNGIYTDGTPEFRTSYPVNLIPVPKQSGISTGYLRPADGIVSNGTGPGGSRGGINWNGYCYRVMGSKLVRVDSDGTVTTLGDVGSGGLVTMDYSFDQLAIASGGHLYYWDGATLTQVTDVDLGTVIDFRWVDGYFMTTDGTSLIVTELNDPTQVNPLKYGSSEADPDPVKAILKPRNEIHALNRHTIEVFSNVGGDTFPFQRNEGAQIQKGTVGTHTCCVYLDAVAFMGGGRNEAIGVYVGANSTTRKLSTQEIDRVLAEFTESELSECKLETRNDGSHTFLYVHLPDRVLVYDAMASEALQEPAWFTLTSTLSGFSEYRARDFVYCYDRWLVGDPQTSNIGFLDSTVGEHWGSAVRWEFGTPILYNEGNSAIIHELELVCLTGRVSLSADPVVWTQYSMDGETWSMPKSVSAGRQGDRNKRICWRTQGTIRNWRMQRFKGTSDAHISMARLEARMEPLTR